MYIIYFLELWCKGRPLRETACFLLNLRDSAAKALGVMNCARVTISTVQITMMQNRRTVNIDGIGIEETEY